MPYPAENITSNQNTPSGFSLNGGVYNVYASPTTRRRYTIHPASGNAGRIKGFKLCRSWSRTFGEMSIQCGGSATVRRRNTGDFYDYRTGLQAWGAAGSISLPGTPALPGGNMINATLVAALNKLKDQDIHVGNFIAEADKSFDTVATAARRIAAGVMAFRKKDPSGWLKVVSTQTGRLARDKWCEIPSLWLELQYGWRPLMQDVFGAIHHLGRSDRYKVPYLVAKAHKQSISSTVINYPMYGGPGNVFQSGGSPSNDVRFEDTQDVWVQLVYGITSPRLAEISSLGLLNPAEIVWEVTPYSFVVDWFLPIGPWLSSLTGDIGFSFVTGSRSSMAKRRAVGVTRKGSWPATYNNAGTIWENNWPNDLSFSGEFGVFDRSCYTTSPVPGLYVKNPLSLDHVANGLSLLSQAFARR